MCNVDPLEAKDKGAGVLQKKGFQQNFSCDLQKRKIKKGLQIISKISGAFQQNFDGSKNSAGFKK